MKKAILLFLVVATVFLAGCVTNGDSSEIGDKIRKDKLSNDMDFLVINKCDDKMVCFYLGTGWSGVMECFRDSDLIEKYCGGLEDE